jgi:hypothetical protein
MILEELVLKLVTEKMKNIRTEALVSALSGLSFGMASDHNKRNKDFFNAFDKIDELNQSLLNVSFLLEGIKEDPEDKYGAKLREYFTSITSSE